MVRKKLTEREKEEFKTAIRLINDVNDVIKIIDIMENEDEFFNDTNFENVLSIACHYGRINIIKYLIELGSNVNYFVL